MELFKDTTTTADTTELVQSVKQVKQLERVIMLLDDALQEARLSREAMLLYIQVFLYIYFDCFHCKSYFYYLFRLIIHLIDDLVFCNILMLFYFC